MIRTENNMAENRYTIFNLDDEACLECEKYHLSGGDCDECDCDCHLYQDSSSSDENDENDEKEREEMVDEEDEDELKKELEELREEERLNSGKTLKELEEIVCEDENEDDEKEGKREKSKKKLNNFYKLDRFNSPDIDIIKNEYCYYTNSGLLKLGEKYFSNCCLFIALAKIWRNLRGDILDNYRLVKSISSDEKAVIDILLSTSPKLFHPLGQKQSDALIETFVNLTGIRIKVLLLLKDNEMSWELYQGGEKPEAYIIQFADHFECAIINAIKKD